MSASPDKAAVYFFDFKNLVSIGYIPLLSDLKSKPVPLSAIDAENSFIIFVSHRGFESSTAAQKNRPIQDTTSNDKYKLILEATEKILPEFAPGAENCYLWIDCSCLEDASTAPPYEAIFELCDIVLSPLFDPEVNDSFSETTEYEANPWSTGAQAYLNRAW